MVLLSTNMFCALVSHMCQCGGLEVYRYTHPPTHTHTHTSLSVCDSKVHIMQLGINITVYKLSMRHLLPLHAFVTHVFWVGCTSTILHTFANLQVVIFSM